MSTIKATSPNREDIQTAVAKAVPGDIVEVPAGTVNWTGQVFSSDGIWIKGAGRDQTKLLKKDDLSEWKAMFTIDCKTGKPFKLSGMHFEGRLQDLQGDNRKTNQTQVRDQGVLIKGKAVDIQIFDCRFTRFLRAGLEFAKGTVAGTSTGVIYRNEIIDCWYSYLGYGVAINGDSAGAWNQPVKPGTATYLYIEDNFFDRCRHFTTAGDGAIYVARYNRCIDNYQDAAAFDMHGLSNAWPRGGRWIEIYRNTVTNKVIRNSGAGIRGGGGVIWGNRWSGVRLGVELQLEKCDKVPYTNYPHQDQIGFATQNGDLHIWDNTGATKNLSIRETNPPNGVTYWIQEPRDYLCQPRPGYVPLVYPHPLRAPNDGGEAASWR
jgi:hypothetical protein